MKRLALVTFLLVPAPVFSASLTITIPPAVVNRSTAAFCSSYSYQPVINGQPNPESPIQFTQRMITNFIKNIVISYETSRAAASSAAAQQAQTTSDMSGIQ